MNAADLFSDITGVLILIYLGLVPIAIIRLRASNRSKNIPSVSISLGIAFTFIGIFVALLDFDVNNIQTSIPQLLGGMKLAFFTSIVGMGIAFFYHMTPDMRLWKAPRTLEKSGATIDTLADHLQSIERALVGEGELTLHTQLQKVRITFTDKMDEMIKAFNSFAEDMAENNTRALIEAVEQVMRDFNAKINEQLGENFKQLNEGIGRMLQWQEEYKDQVGFMMQQLNNTCVVMESTEQIFTAVEKRSLRFAETAKLQEKVIVAYHRQIEGLEEHLEAFAQIAANASSAFPVIEKNLKDLTEGFSQGVTQATNQMTEAAREQRETVAKMVQQTSEDITKQFKVLDDELGNELKKALTTLGSQLFSLSSKFVKDYTPLTEELQRLVKMTGTNGRIDRR